MLLTSITCTFLFYDKKGKEPKIKFFQYLFFRPKLRTIWRIISKFYFVFLMQSFYDEMVICRNQGLLRDKYLFSPLKVKHLGTNLQIHIQVP